MRLTTLYEGNFLDKWHWDRQNKVTGSSHVDAEFVKLANIQKYLWDQLKVAILDPSNPAEWSGDWGYSPPAEVGVELDNSNASKRLRREWKYLLRDMGKLISSISYSIKYKYIKWCKNLGMPTAQPEEPPIKKRGKPAKSYSPPSQGLEKVKGNRDVPRAWKQHSRGLRDPWSGL